jgi:N-acyl-D-amino-acid deacylase
MASTADLVLRNATLIDGSGTPADTGDLAIADDRLVAVGVVPDVLVGSETTDLDVDGSVVAPGFVDVHTHDDGALLRHPGMAFKLAQGCTSLVIGNCGFSAAPAAPGVRDPNGLLGTEPSWSDLAGYAAAVEAAGPAVNAMALVGHNTIRTLVLGEERREPSDAELDEMRELVRSAMEQGACGFSTGLVYRPGRWATTDELIALTEIAAEFGGLYATHMRNEGDHLLEAVDEAIHIGRTAGTPVQISHHKSAGRRNWGRIGLSLAKVDEANAAGADVTLDVYPYTAGSGPMAHYFDLERIDPELADVIRFATCPPFPDYEGRTAIEVAAEQGVTPSDVIRQVLTAPKGDRTLCIQFIIDEADIETNLRHPLMMVGSDGIPDLGGRPHPRLFGTFPKVLAHYVRNRGVLSLEEAVRRMTSLSCERFGLVDRGRLVEGGFADVVVFDPATVQDTATYDDPQQEPEGMKMVVVNGRVAYDHGAHTGVGAGRMLRYPGSR